MKLAGDKFLSASIARWDLVVYGKKVGQGLSARSKIMVQRLDNQEIMKEIDLPPTFGWHKLGWAPDGHALTLVHDTTVVRNPLAIHCKRGTSKALRMHTSGLLTAVLCTSMQGVDSSQITWYL